MSTWIVAPSGLIEPVPPPIIYVHGIGAIEMVDDANICTHWFCEHLTVETPQTGPQKTTVLKTISPLGGVPARISLLAQCLVKTPMKAVMAHYDGPRLVP